MASKKVKILIATAAIIIVLGMLAIAVFYATAPEQDQIAKPFSFSLIATPNNGTVIQGGNTTLTLEATYLSGNAAPITFSASGGPNGTSYYFTDQIGKVTNIHPFRSNLTISTPADANSDSYLITISGSAANSSGAKTRFNLAVLNSEITVSGTITGTSVSLAGYPDEEIFPTDIKFTSNTTGETYEVHVKRYGDTEQYPGKVGNFTITLPNLQSYKVWGYFFSLPHGIPVARVGQGDTEKGYFTLNCTVGVKSVEANFWG